MSKRTSLLILFAILLLGGFFRFYLITEIPLGLYPDEAMNGNNALEALAADPPAGGLKIFYPENNGREGLFINIQAISLWLFGNEPWALRLVSAVIGTLTILSIFLVTKELFTSRNKAAASSTALDLGAGMVSPAGEERRDRVNPKFTLGTLDVRGDTVALYIALLSSFFFATSFWHINFSRIGFRAIMIPLLAAFGTYFLLKGLRLAVPGLALRSLKAKPGTAIWNIIFAGIFIGLGFHTYIAFRFMPFVLAVPLVWYLWKWRQTRRNQIIGFLQSRPTACIPCLIVLFLFVVFIVALPIGFYFLQNPGDFIGRTGQVSIFSAESPLLEFAKSNLATIGMFFFSGDCNWRHNYACQPELHPLIGVFFFIGVITAIRGFFKSQITKHKSQTSTNNQNSNAQNRRVWNLKKWNLFGIWNLEFGILFAWLFFLSLPATLTREGLPHALRAIGMIPPVMIIAGLGAWKVLELVFLWLEKQKEKWPQYAEQLTRIKREMVLLFILVLLLVPVFTFRSYFVRWAHNPQTYFAFSTDLLHLGQFLNNLPLETKKYVVVNLSGAEVRGVPMPAQTVMFVTDTFREEERQRKNIQYILPSELEKIILGEGKTIIGLLKGDDRGVLRPLQERFPELKVKAPGDFVILEN